MAGTSAPCPRKWLPWAGVLMLTAASCAEPPGGAQVALTAPPVPAGEARIWFYRNWLPSESLNLANIDVNGSYYGSVANGSAFSSTSFESRGHPADQLLIVERAQIEISVVRRRLERPDKLREFAFCFPAHLFGVFDSTETKRSGLPRRHLPSLGKSAETTVAILGYTPVVR